MKKIESFLNNYSGYKTHFGGLDRIQYQNLSIDTRTIKQGELYIALQGENFDGHDFITQANKKNAGGMVVEENWYTQQTDIQDTSTVYIIVTNTQDFLQRLSSWHRHQFQIPVIGITGSNGKTTIKKMIVEILLKKFQIVNTEGNQNNHIGVPLTLLKLRSDHEIAVIEMGSNHPGEIEFLANLVNPTMALITNIGKGHIGYFGDLEAIYREKIALFEQLSKDSTIFKNMEDPYLRRYNRFDLKSIEVGTSKNYDVWGEIESVNRYGCIRFTLNDITSIQLQLPGVHQFINSLIAAAVAIQSGISVEKIKEALKFFLPANQRMEISENNEILFINDAYNANPDSTRVAIDYVATLNIEKGKRIIVLGDMLELGEFEEKEHELIGHYFQNKPIDYLFLYGNLTQHIKETLFKDNSFSGQVFWYKTHEEITQHLNEILHPGDVLLIKGSRGMKMELVLQDLKKFGKK